jgi:hypothetical protein
MCAWGDALSRRMAAVRRSGGAHGAFAFVSQKDETLAAKFTHARKRLAVPIGGQISGRLNRL